MNVILSKFLGFLFFFIFFSAIPLNLPGAEVEKLIPVVIHKIPHSLPAFTQGLAIDEECLYESTGLYGQSNLRVIDPASGRTLDRRSVPSSVFAEGIAVFPNQIIQVSWKEQMAFVYQRPSLKIERILFYQGDGWGLCSDGETVWMSDGSSFLTQRKRGDLSQIKKVQVCLRGKPVDRLNDLECVGDALYANVWPKDWILKIDKSTGEVMAIVDASRLLSPAEKKRLGPDEVLNGIAFHPERKTFFLTGKEWPWIFEVQFQSISSEN